MGEQLFTVFEGSDEGMTFTVGERPVALGRGPGCDVALKDERASRVHARLSVSDGVVRLRDLDSSNGAFVNGRLVTECVLNPGDVIGIGNTRIVYGAKPPSPAPAPDDRRRRADLSGEKTEILVGGEPPLPVRPAAARFGAVLEAVVAFCRPLAESLDVLLSLETDAPSDRIQVDVRKAHRAVSGLIKLFLTVHGELKPTGAGEQDATLALRLASDPASAGVVVEIVWMGPLFPQDRVVGLDAEGAVETARTIVNAHGGSFELFPAASPETLARLRFPLGNARESRPTIVRRRG